MPTLSANLSMTLDLCGSIEYPNLIGRTARIINQQARMMMREARLSDQNQYLSFLPLSGPSKEADIPSIVDPNSICTVERLVDVTNDIREDVPIIPRVNLNEWESQGRIACARFAMPTKLRFTWDPSLSSDTIYVGYELTPVDADMQSIPALPEDFHDCLQYRSAAIVKEMAGKACGPVFLDTLKRVEKQWTQWCERDADERTLTRPGFGDLDISDPMVSW